MTRSLVGMLTIALFIGACKTAEGPRLALPTQEIDSSVPAGYVRVVFFNDTLEGLNFASGTMRIQVDGRTAPSLYLNHYAQLFLKPGKYDLMLEHWDLFKFTDHYQVEITPPESHFRIWTTPFGNEYESMKTLPPGFESRFTGGRDSAQWPKFELE